MDSRARFEKLLRVLGVVSLVSCLGAAAFVLALVVWRLPALGASRLEMLFGTLQAVAVSLLMVIAGLLVNVMAMVRRVLRAQTVPATPD
jgi:hypothetical protein